MKLTLNVVQLEKDIEEITTAAREKRTWVKPSTGTIDIELKEPHHIMTMELQRDTEIKTVVVNLPQEKRNWICPTIELISTDNIEGGFHPNRPETVTLPGFHVHSYGTIS